MRGFLFIVIAAAAAGLAGRAQQPPADLIVHNARVYTVDPKRPTAEAVAARGDRLVFVGDNRGALALRGPSTRVIDASGATVVPGLQDAHGHFTGLGQSLQRLDFRRTTSYEQIVEMVRQAAAKARPGEWILGRGWDQNDWPEKRFPTKAPLDRAAPQNPVYLTRIDGHAGLANSLALRLAGVTRETQNPEGGEIIRDASGEPTGVLIDRAQGLVTRRIPPPPREQLIDQILLADRECRRLGLTMVHDAGTSGAVADLYRQLVDEGRIQTRLYVMLRHTLEELRPHFARGPLIGYAAHRLTVRAIKITADGALGSYGAALLEPYADRPESRGLLTETPDEIYRKTLEASKAKFQTCIHAIGDRANRIVLDIFERVQREVPGARDLRLRVEHAQILDRDDIPRFARLGVIASMQATHATSDMPWAPTRLGPERTAEGAYVWRKLLRTGAIIANGSDFPVEEANPMLGLYAAVTRQDPSGHPPGGWMPEERMTREEALASFTIHAAYAAHLERELGSLEPGKLADLVVLSKDIMTVPAREILTTRVLYTIVGGRVVYEAAAGSASGPLDARAGARRQAPR
ncbi:MAG TPA: amidohydrolase [Vicinamibacterales bacterium]|nr:amidohydrolase [Vicinamibacterales bacterium]